MLKTKLILERLDKDGKLLERKEQQSRSFLIQFMQFMQLMHDNIIVNIQDITDTTRAAGLLFNQFGIAAPGGHGAASSTDDPEDAIEGEKIGIVVGTGHVAAAAPDDYALETRIAHGNGGGEFEYGGNEILPLVIADPNAEFTIRRYFTNNSGGTITVYEVGIYAVLAVGIAEAYAACIARDVVGAGVAVADTEILRVTYVPQITV